MLDDVEKLTWKQVGFLFILGFSIFTKWLISILITSVVLCWMEFRVTTIMLNR